MNLWLGTLLVLVAITIGAFIFSTIIFGIIDRMQRQLGERERELAVSRAVAEERERIAREMHDGLGQVLGYVNTKVQAAKEHMDRGESASAQTHLQQLEEAAREVYADIREAILGLRTTLSEERGLMPAVGQYLHQYSLQS
ncbi:MAG: hypothetical protein HY660_01870, partial [Armatimonadetes bacterium]|nr:hypothetical protein [Armatimonadota bacterium]